MFAHDKLAGPGTSRRLPATYEPRLLALAGVLGWSLIFAGAAVMATPTADLNPASQPFLIAATYAEHRDAMRLGVSLTLWGCFLALFFLGYLQSRISSAAAEPQWMGSVGLAGGVVAIALLAVHAAIFIAVTNTQIESLPNAAQTLFLVDWAFGGAVNPPLGALVGATSVAIIRQALLGRRIRILGWVGLPLAAATGLSGFLGGALAFLSLLWLIALAAACLYRP